jgi:hypothetical protein
MLLIAIGLALLVPTSPMAQSWLLKLRRRYRPLDRQLEAIEPRLPKALRLALRKTRAQGVTG